jgi:outer membrane translocation and assembly module TamA
VGLGVRLFSPVGKISVDIAQSVTDSDSSKQLHISIGPDL